MTPLKLPTHLAMGLLSLLLLSGPLMAHDWQYKQEMDDSMMDKALADLNLNPDQQAKISDARMQHRSAMEKIINKKKNDLESLRTEVNDNASNDDLKETLHKIKEDMKDMVKLQEKFHEKLEDILTPRQKAKMILGKMDEEGK